jgi:hypothetical protein
MPSSHRASLPSSVNRCRAPVRRKRLRPGLSNALAFTCGRAPQATDRQSSAGSAAASGDEFPTLPIYV